MADGVIRAVDTVEVESQDQEKINNLRSKMRT